jgi:uncharacterized membrane protein
LLAFYRRFAQRLHPWRSLLLIGALGIGLVFVAMLFAGAEQGPYLLPLLVTALLCGCLLLMVQLFSQPAREAVSRWRRGLTALVHWLMALLLTGILLVWFFLFLKALFAIIRQNFF